MRIVYFDIDTLRADHLGCYGYHRATSPTIDSLAADGIRFTAVHASDTPCLPSRTALSSGRYGTLTGVVGHGGTAADPVPEGARRGFRSTGALHSWASAMQGAGLWTASISTFADRHSAFHFNAGFHETFNLGTRGLETADQVAATAVDWIRRNAQRDSWFLHLNLWDPHTPYRTPTDYGDPFSADPAPTWLTEEVRAAHWKLPGPHSAQEIAGFGPRQVWDDFPRQPTAALDMQQARRMFDGYDTGVRYADDHVGRVLEALDQLGRLDDTAILVSSDHGEALGELGIYCDHQTADFHTTRVPAVLRWPGIAGGRVDGALHYQFDLAATVIELLGAEVPETWDGRSFAPAMLAGRSEGRSHLVLTQGAWTTQRSVRTGDWLCIRTYDAGMHAFPPVMLFDVSADPHEQHDRAEDRPTEVRHALEVLEHWKGGMMDRLGSQPDPLDTITAEGGPWHVRGFFELYMRRLRETGRARWADAFEAARTDPARVLEPAPVEPPPGTRPRPA